MKTKILVLLFALTLLLSATSCSNKPSEAYLLYTAARELYLGGYEASVSIEVDGAGGSVHVEVQNDYVATVNSLSGHARYFADGMMYQRGYILGGNSCDDKIKYPNTTKQAFCKDHLSFFGFNPYAECFPTFTEEELRDVKMTKSGRYRSFTAALSFDAIKNYFGDAQITAGEGTFYATFDANDAMRSMKMEMTVTYADGTQKAVTVTYTFAASDTAPEVGPPTDESEYIEM